MTLPKSHKHPAAYSEHEQTRTHAPVSKAAYGVDTSNHPSRRGWEAMDRHEAQLKDIASQKLEAARRGGY